MMLPTVEQLEELSGLVIEEGKKTRGKWYKYNSMMSFLNASKGPAVNKAITTAVTKGAAALGVTTGTAFIPFGMVLAPWIGAASIYIKSNAIFGLHDIKQNINTGSPGSYTCACEKCSINIQYIIDKKDRKNTVTAVSIFTAGVPKLGTSLNSIRKHFQSGRPKEMKSRALVESARRGCTAAMATIFLLSGKWSLMKRPELETMNTAVAIITSEDGWEELKSRW